MCHFIIKIPDMFQKNLNQFKSPNMSIYICVSKIGNYVCRSITLCHTLLWFGYVGYDVTLVLLQSPLLNMQAPYVHPSSICCQSNCIQFCYKWQRALHFKLAKSTGNVGSTVSVLKLHWPNMEHNSLPCLWKELVIYFDAILVSI